MKVCIIQFSAGRTLNYVTKFIDKSMEYKPELLCLSPWKGSTALVGKSAFNTMNRASEPLSGNTIKTLQKKAKEHEIYIAGTYIHEKTKNNKFYHTFPFIDNHGDVVGYYRAVHSPYLDPASEWKKKGAQKCILTGNEFKVFKTDIANIGILGSWDIRYPEASRVLRLSGADLIVCSLHDYDLVFDGVHVNLVSLCDTIPRGYASSNWLYFVLCSKCGTNKYDYDKFGVNVRNLGHSCVIDPNGNFIVRAGYKETILTADLDIKSLHKRSHAVKFKEGLIKTRKPSTYHQLVRSD